MSLRLLSSLLTLAALPGLAAAASVNLSVSGNPVLLGQPVTLITSIQPANANGSVTFYSGSSILGIAPVSAGQASFTTAVLPGGVNRLSARFQATASNAVNLAVGVSPGTGFSGGVIDPVGLTPSATIAADFNNDGIADLAVSNAGDGTVSVFVGNGDGSFQPLPATNVGNNPVSLSVADFNGDGIQDILVVNNADGSVVVLTGNGDGTFQAQSPIALGSSPISAGVADLNGDGIADIAVVDSSDNTVTILTGVGDGTFTLSNPISVGFSPSQIAIADFNGDGLADLAISGTLPDGVLTLLGNGDTTFTLGPILDAGTGPSSLVTTDFNGDGLVDLAVGDFDDQNGGGIQVLLGNGDGSFQAPILAATGPNVIALAIADFDGDGRMDIGAVTLDGFVVFLGNGDGTLQSQQSYSAGASPDALAIGSFDGTGLTEVAVVNRNENELDVLSGSLGTCSYSLSPTTPLLYDASATGGTISLASSATGCSWTLTSDSWIIPQPASSLGSGSVSFQVLANDSGYDRVGALAIGGSSLTITQRFTAQLFSDVPLSSYQFNAANLLKGKGITSGCTPSQYCPQGVVSRDQMAIFIVRSVYGSDNFTSSPTPYFADVPPSAFGFRWIQKLKELGITSGCSPSDYCPTQAVTRAQMAIFIIRGRFGSTASFSSPSSPSFTDVPTGAFAFQWIQRMKLDGITNGCNVTLYCPNNSVTRGDMAIFIMRGMFNELYPPNTPTLTSVSPSILLRGQPGTFTFIGSGTGFLPGLTTVATVPLVAVSNVQVASPTLLTVDFLADPSAPVQPVGVVAITGAEQDVLPSGVIIQ